MPYCTNLLVPVTIPMRVGFDVKINGPFLSEFGFFRDQASDGRELLGGLEHGGRVHLYAGRKLEARP